MVTWDNEFEVLGLLLVINGLRKTIESVLKDSGNDRIEMSIYGS